MKPLLTLLLFFSTFCLSAQIDPIQKMETNDGAPDDDDTVSVVTTPAPDSLQVSDSIYENPEVRPVFPGTQTFGQYVISSMRYPQKEKEENRQGTVYVSFIVEKDGSVSNVSIAKGISGAPGLEKEAMRVIRSSPKWTPGTNAGQPVRCKMVQPVKFNLM